MKKQSNYSKKYLDECLSFGIKVAKKTGKKLVKKQKKLSTLSIDFKAAQGVASDADLEAEAIIISEINKKFQDHEVLAEESAWKKYKNRKEAYLAYSKKEWCWIVDPLDGTSNYLNGLGYYAICICLTNYGKPVVGIVYRPETGETFTAIEGRGFKKITGKASKKVQSFENKKKMKDSLGVTGFVSEKEPFFEEEFEILKNMSSKLRGLRRMGSAALDLCYVAEGLFDCFWESGLSPWDVAAAGLICQEAGVKVSDFDGKSFTPFQKSIVAARAPLFSKVKKSINLGRR